MAKVWNGKEWICGRIDQDRKVFVVGTPVRFMPIDDDGFVRYGSVKFRLFTMDATEPNYYAMKVT